MKISQQESPVPYPEVDELDCIRWVTRVVAIGGSFVALHNNRIIGSIGIGVEQFTWNTRYEFLTNEWFYVHPKFRRAGVAVRLISGAKAMSDSSGRPFLFSVTSGIDKRIDRFIAMQGFKPIGSMLTYGMGEREDGRHSRQQITDGIEESGVAG